MAATSLLASFLSGEERVISEFKTEGGIVAAISAEAIHVSICPCV